MPPERIDKQHLAAVLPQPRPRRQGHGQAAGEVGIDAGSAEKARRVEVAAPDRLVSPQIGERLVGHHRRPGRPRGDVEGDEQGNNIRRRWPVLRALHPPAVHDHLDRTGRSDRPQTLPLHEAIDAGEESKRGERLDGVADVAGRSVDEKSVLHDSPLVVSFRRAAASDRRDGGGWCRRSCGRAPSCRGTCRSRRRECRGAWLP